MKRRISFEVKIIVILLFILVFAMVNGFLAYKRVSTIVSNSGYSSRYEMRIVAVKNLEKDLSLAENNVKSYSLTKDTTYLLGFFDAIGGARTKLDIIMEMASHDESLVQLFDSLYVLVEEKIRILNDLLSIQGNFRVQIALDKAENKIEKSALKLNEESGKDRKEFESFSLFKKRRERKALESKLQENKITLRDVSEELEKVRSEEKNIEAILKAQELALIDENRIVSQKVAQLINEFELRERSLIEDKAIQSQIAVKDTNKQIAVFSFLTVVLLIFMAFVIIKYIKNNNHYREVLRKARKEAEDLMKTKDRFFTNMSHEIRTPMNAIAGFTERLADTRLEEHQQQHLQIIRKSVDHLLNIINDVLDYSKLKSGKLSLENNPFNVKEVISDVFHLSEPISRNKKIQFTLKIDKTVPDILMGDHVRLRQILLNLVSNALKFTESGHVHIFVSSSPVENKKVTLNIQVIDSGIGMSENELKKVFDEFEQVEKSTTRNYGGTGLGLTITKKLVELHNGQIEIDSKVNVGTKVIIQLPYKTGEKPEKLPEIRTNKKSDLLNQLRVLIVDDEKYNRLLLTAILKKHNAIYTESSNGYLALLELDMNDYDLILMDVRMPHMNGLETVQKIRSMKSGRKSQIPVIALTAAVSPENQLEYKKAGMNGFLPKPYSEEELIKCISDVLVKETVSDFDK